MGHLAYLSKSDAWIQAENPAPGPSESTEPPIRFFLQVPRHRLPHLWTLVVCCCYRSAGVVLELASIRLNIKRSTGLAAALALLRAWKHCWKFWAEETSLPQTGIPWTAVSVRPTARIPIVQAFRI